MPAAPCLLPDNSPGLLLRPAGAFALLVLAHGAGAGMSHPFLAALAEALAHSGVATLRYQFPYLERGGGRPDPPAVLVRRVRAAAAFARSEGGLPLFAGGKSLGGRMTSTAQAEEPLPQVRGLVFYGFPLHPPGKPGVGRAEHLDRVAVPMLFLQGTRDALADPGLLREVTGRLGPRATLHEVEGADHAFAVLRRSGRTAEEVMQELAGTTADWMRGVLA
ncbi:MAG TPA: alpha/beta family hydrolase [Gemmatimonadales bacterium]|nr:alpha/beta family hydrolase [Gemmatimonadales bacterium]